MIKRSEANRALLRAHREQAAKLRALYTGSNSHGRKTTEKQIPPEQLAAIKQEIRRQARREQRKRALIAGVLILLAIGVLGYSIYLYVTAFISL